MSRDRTPQAKKHHSLTRDRRNTYGEHDKSSRTAIRQRKRLASRLRRQALRRALERSAATAEDAGVDVPAPRGQWRKCPDTPLGVVLHRRRLRRFERALRDRVRDDPTFLDRLGPALIHHGVDERAARDVVGRLRAALLTWQRDHPQLAGDILTLLQRLVRRPT
jgi:hypothetical protein